METLITDNGRHKIILTDNLDFRTEKKCINDAFSLVDKNKILNLFDKMAPLLSDQAYWYALGHAYNSCDWSEHYSYEGMKRFFCSYRPHREYLMNNAERRRFNSLPKTVNIHRAMTALEKDSGQFGLSWTLSKRVVEFYANDKRNSKGQNTEETIHSISVDKDKLIAYFNGKKEKEIIYCHCDSPFDDLPF